MTPEAVHRRREDARRGELQWCQHCHCFHHLGVCPCRDARTALEADNAALKAKVAELRGLLADYVTAAEADNDRIETSSPAD